jgi:hypothetical protein
VREKLLLGMKKASKVRKEKGRRMGRTTKARLAKIVTGDLLY